MLNIIIVGDKTPPCYTPLETVNTLKGNCSKVLLFVVLHMNPKGIKL